MVPTAHALDTPVYAALTTRQAELAEMRRRSPLTPDVAPFVAVPSDPTADDWRDAADVIGPGGFAGIVQTSRHRRAPESSPPLGWRGGQALHVGDGHDLA